MSKPDPTLDAFLAKVRSCTLCAAQLPLGPKPIISLDRRNRIVLVSQAPGRLAHNAGIAYRDPSGERLRAWLGVDEEVFYNSGRFAIVPMGFCYPGKLGAGDAPPRPECAPTWHDAVWDHLGEAVLVILIGAYAQKSYLGSLAHRTLGATVKAYRSYRPRYFPIPHPSPRNNIWLRRNAWFEDEVVPVLQSEVAALL